MTIRGLFKSIFGPPSAEPPSPARLDAGSDAALSRSLGALPAGHRAWITMQEARHLFSPMEDEYAFGEMDDQGRANLAGFGAKHGASFDIMPVEGRIYFSRNAK
jgi:hypothetical protein